MKEDKKVIQINNIINKIKFWMTLKISNHKIIMIINLKVKIIRDFPDPKKRFNLK